MFTKKIKLLLLMIFLSITSALASTYTQGVNAYHDGNYTKAAKLLKKGCDSGNGKGCTLVLLWPRCTKKLF